MLQSNNIITFNEYQGIDILKIIKQPLSITIYGNQRKEEQCCPICKTRTSLVHDYRTQTIKDIPYGMQSVSLIFSKRRLVCPHCGKKFIQRLDFLQKWGRMTKSLIAYILDSLRDTVSFKHVAQHSGVSEYTVKNVFNCVEYGCYKLPPVLAIDEFKGNTGGEKYQAILTNPEKKKVLDILPNREKQSLREYFCQFSNRKDVRFFVMDMWRPYKELCEEMFPNAKICIDKYHYTRQVYWAFEKVRKNQQKLFSDEKRLLFKRSRSLLWKDYDKLKFSDKMKVLRMLENDERIDLAWQLKELFTDFRKATGRANAEVILTRWIAIAEESNLIEFKDATRALVNWKEYILNTVEYGFTNGYTEGKNNKIKVLKRISFGYRNFRVFRNRILHNCN